MALLILMLKIMALLALVSLNFTKINKNKNDTDINSDVSDNKIDDKIINLSSSIKK